MGRFDNTERRMCSSLQFHPMCGRCKLHPALPSRNGAGKQSGHCLEKLVADVVALYGTMR